MVSDLYKSITPSIGYFQLFELYRLKKKNDHLCGLCNEPNLLTRVSGYLISKLPRLRKSQVLNLELSSLLLLEVFCIWHMNCLQHVKTIFNRVLFRLSEAISCPDENVQNHAGQK